MDAIIEGLLEWATDADGKVNQKDFAKLIINQCGYYADLFEETKSKNVDSTASDYIKKRFGIK